MLRLMLGIFAGSFFWRLMLDLRLVRFRFFGWYDFVLGHLIFLYRENVLMSLVIALFTMSSTTKKYAANANTAAMTTAVVARTCFQDGHVTRRISICSSSK